MTQDAERTSETLDQDTTKDMEEISAEGTTALTAEDAQVVEGGDADTGAQEMNGGAVPASLQDKIAELVRQNAREAGSVTDVDDLAELAPELDPDRFGPVIVDMVRDVGEYADIKLAVTPSDAPYLFSEAYLTPDEAVAQADVHDIRRTIAEQVRADSQDPVKLTSLDSLLESLPQLDLEGLQAHLTEITDDEHYQDIKSIEATTGAVYYYSEMFMTGTYATILMRAEVDDPLATIVDTVRDESRIYPRPTRIDLFDAEVFKIDADKLETYVEEILGSEEYGDIGKIVASTDTVWLYSKQYMSEDQARAHVEWEEVEQHDYP